MNKAKVTRIIPGLYLIETTDGNAFDVERLPNGVWAVTNVLSTELHRAQTLRDAIESFRY